MKKENESDYIIEQFTLQEEDFGEFAKLITSSFLSDGAAQEEGATIVFNEDTFRMMFGAPSVNRDLFVKATHKESNEIVGFLGAIPRELKIVDKNYKFGIPCWLCVHSKHQRKGIATALGEKLFSIGIDAKYAGGFSLFEPKQHGKDISRIVAKKENIIIKRVVSVDQFVVRVLNAKKMAKVVKVKWFEKLAFRIFQGIPKVKSTNVRNHKKSDADRLFELLMEHVHRNQLSIVPKKKDFEWVLEQPGVICVVHTNQEDIVNGFFLAWEFNLAGFGYHFPCGWLDIVHIHGLTRKEAKELALFLSLASRNRGWIGLQTPYIPYFDPKPLQKAKFIFFPQTLHLDLMLLEEIDIPEVIESFYFDWR
ncbi:MAG: GNAT family N-acetyltransferase [Candidatus Heimdallarchaeaceae archaeon]